MGNLFSSNKQAKETKVILLTGASAGIGKDAALTLIQRGHIVYGAARRVDKMQDLVKAGGHAIALDVTNEQQVNTAVNRIMQEQGRIDVLVNNAGYAEYGSVEDIDMETARRQFEVNLFGLAQLTKKVLPHMRKANKGTIVNVSSVAGKCAVPFGAWYIASKHALEGWSDCLRVELKPFNIKVAVVEPGAIRTEFAGVMMGPMLERSKGSPYEPYVKNFEQTGTAMESSGSPPSVITNVIIKAAESANPKRRYVAGAYSKTFLFVKAWLGDAFFDFMYDKMIMSS